jgi:hypothetical protein
MFSWANLVLDVIGWWIRFRQAMWIWFNVNVYNTYKHQPIRTARGNFHVHDVVPHAYFHTITVLYHCLRPFTLQSYVKYCGISALTFVLRRDDDIVYFMVNPINRRFQVVCGKYERNGLLFCGSLAMNYYLPPKVPNIADVD